MVKVEINKTAIKNFAVDARNKLREEVGVKAGLLGIDEEGIKEPADRSTDEVQFFSESDNTPGITGQDIGRRNSLVKELRRRTKDSTFAETFEQFVEEVAYTWFNRLIAIRFMEVNDYLPDGIRVLSSLEGGNDPDIIREFADSSLNITSQEQAEFLNLRLAGDVQSMDKLYRSLFIKQCNALNAILPELFEQLEDYTELLFAASYTDAEGVIAHLVNDVPENNFNVSEGGQIEIIGWMYQYYNTEPKDKVFSRPKSQKIRKEDIPAATQLFTPDWIVRYMVENSLGRFYIDQKLANPNEARTEKEIADGFGWKYYLPAAEQPEDVQLQIIAERKDKSVIALQELFLIDPSMGSGHILVYAFDVFMQLYEAEGESSRRAAELILQNNLYGLDIDKRAFQLAYFALMMKGREYNRRILNRGIQPNVYDIPDNAGITEDDLVLLPLNFNNVEKGTEDLKQLIRNFKDGNDLGSLIQFEEIDFENLEGVYQKNNEQQLTFDGSAIHGMIQVAKLLSRKYQVTITNPPYMGSNGFNPVLSNFAKKNYPSTKSDLSTMFMEQMQNFTTSSGYYSLLNIPTWMFLTSYEKLRREIMSNATIINMSHNGRGIFGSDFGSTSFVIRNNRIDNYKGTYLRLFENSGDVHSVSQKEEWFLQRKNQSIVAQEQFTKIPGMPISYWVSENLIHDFETGTRIDEIVSPKVGLQTGKNNDFLRLWWEVSIDDIKFDATSIENSVTSGKKWFPYNKGGSFRRWYGNYDYVVNWENDGQEIRNFVDEKGKLRSRPQNTDFYFREAITWSDITSGSFSLRYRELGSMHDVKGMSAFGNDSEELFYLLGLMNTTVANYIFKILNPTISLQIGNFQSFPVISGDIERQTVIDMAKKAVQISKDDWNSKETAWGFVTNPYFQFNSSSLIEIQKEYDNLLVNTRSKLLAIENSLNNQFVDIYGLNDDLPSEITEEDLTLSDVNHLRDVKQFISYAVGCMFGRYSLGTETLTFAGGQWSDLNYQPFQPDQDNILLISDDKYFEDSSIDIVNRFIDFVSIAFGTDNLEGNLQYISDVLTGKGTSREVIRNYFVKDFYSDHLQMYKAVGSGNRPIYWQFESGKNRGFKALIYLHRYMPDILGTMRVDYLHQLQKAYENTIEQLQAQIQQSSSSADKNTYTKQLQKVLKQYEETKDYDAKLGHLANMKIELDLDDGVIFNYDKLQTDENGENLKVLSPR